MRTAKKSVKIYPQPSYLRGVTRYGIYEQPLTSTHL